MLLDGPRFYRLANARALSGGLGMTPALSAFSGHVPQVTTERRLTIDPRERRLMIGA